MQVFRVLIIFDHDGVNLYSSIEQIEPTVSQKKFFLFINSESHYELYKKASYSFHSDSGSCKLILKERKKFSENTGLRYYTWKPLKWRIIVKHEKQN